MDLSPFGRNILERIRLSGKEGFNPSREKIQGADTVIALLVREGSVIPLRNGVYYGRETYIELVHSSLYGCTAGDLISIQQVKEQTGLSRSYAIPLLNRMEADGYVQREENLRRVIRTE